MLRRELLQSLAALALESRAFPISGISEQAASSNQNAVNAPAAKEGLLVHAEENRNRAGISNNHFLISAKDTGGALSILGPLLPPGQPTATPSANGTAPSRLPGGIPLHIHYEQDEYWYTISGETLIQVGDKRIHAKPGDLVMGPRGVPHSPRGITPGLGITIFQPAGTMEEFFHELALARQKIPGGRPDDQTMAALFKAHGMEIVGPPPQI